jgi:hypothetical protein
MHGVLNGSKVKVAEIQKRRKVPIIYHLILCTLFEECHNEKMKRIIINSTKT